VHFFLALVCFFVSSLNADIKITAPRARGSLKTETIVYESPTVVYDKTTTITATTLSAHFKSKEKEPFQDADLCDNVKLVDENKIITCSRGHYDHTQKKLTLSGTVVITYKDIKKKQSAFAQADIVVYDCTSKEVTLTAEKNRLVTTIITT
jgi:lipopolysaccharide export system protein LptA